MCYSSIKLVLCILAAICCVQNAYAVHPSLFFDQTDIPVLKSKVQIPNSIAKEAYTRMLKDAGSFVNISTNPYQFYGHGISGRTMAMQVTTLALAGYLTDNISYTNKGIAILYSAAQQREPADFNDENEELAVADAALAYAVGYDMLQPFMTADQNNVISAEVYKFGLWLYVHAPGAPWDSNETGRLAWNHNAVAHGGAGLCALALGNQPEWLNWACKSIRGYFEYGFDSTGASYEGLDYFCYGMASAMPFAVALQRSGGPDILLENASTRLIPQFVLSQIVPAGKATVPINQSTGLSQSAACIWLTNKFKDRTGLWGWLRLCGPTGTNTYGQSGWPGDGAVLPYVILWSDPNLVPQSPIDGGTPQSILLSQGQGVFRDGWEDDDTLVTFRSAYAWHGHWNQADALSFTFYSRGEVFAIDPGATYGDMSNHNGLLIDGSGPSNSGGWKPSCAKVVKTQFTKTTSYIMGDANQAYLKQGGIQVAKRQLLFVRAPRPYLLIADDIQKDSNAHAFMWLLHTASTNAINIDPVISGRADIVGSKTGAVCKVQFFWPSVQLSQPDISPAPVLAANSTAVNPRFIVMLIALKPGETMPIITKSGNLDNMQITIKFSDDYIDYVTIYRDDISFGRYAPGECIGSNLPGDFNQDCTVDFAVFAQEWLVCAE